MKNLTLEISLKPFKKISDAYIKGVCEKFFEQWLPLCRRAETISVLIWVSDGSEILDYKGNMDYEFEWCKYIGVAPNQIYTNPSSADPENLSIHRHPYLYTDSPPIFTYGILKNLVSIIKKTGRRITGKKIRTGATFDPGPEFAKSDFKYKKHPEICDGLAFGDKKCFVCCYKNLKADSESYAGFPDGIPEDTPFGFFLGRQAKHFMKDMRFDYIWLSNGFGFGMETWGSTGAVFNGIKYDTGKCDEIRKTSLLFWKLFRKGLGKYPIETRGTNLTTGKDLAADAVPLMEIYNGGFDLEPPPNSPWAALNGNFGLELAGWMSHIAEIPGTTYPFRFYTHDPWFLNSPWLDRYQREAHDIYLPMAVSRINEKGLTHIPSSINFLTVDDSLGNLPDIVPYEVIPKIIDCLDTAPDEPGPFIWGYPFREHHEMTFERPERISEVFFGDWFISEAINQGLPLNTVVSLEFIASGKFKPSRETTLIVPAGAVRKKEMEAIIDFINEGGRVLFYGPVANAPAEFLKMMDLTIVSSLEGDFEISLADEIIDDEIFEGTNALKITHASSMSGGGLDAICGEQVECLAKYTGKGEARAAAVFAHSGKGMVAWVRGTSHFIMPEKPGQKYFETYKASQNYPTAGLMRKVLQKFGMHIRFSYDNPENRIPMSVISRHENAFYFAGYNPDTTVKSKFLMPQGAPLFTTSDARIVNENSEYNLPMAWRKECRVFISQKEGGVVKTKIEPSSMFGVKKRLKVCGLKNAGIRFFYETGSLENLKVLQNPSAPYLTGNFLEFKDINDSLGKYILVEKVSGNILFSW